MLDNEEWIYKWSLAVETVLWNRFWFVKWLYNNDKLEPQDVMRKAILDSVKEWEGRKAYIQWLALSDEPINDLISYLK